MKDLPMFNKLFFVLCSSLLIALTSPSAAEEPTYITIQGSGGEYEVFGTEQEAQTFKRQLRTQEVRRLLQKISSALNWKASLAPWDRKIDPRTENWAEPVYMPSRDYQDRIIAEYRAQIKAEEQKIIAPMGEEREKKYKAQKIADAKAKLILKARLAKIAADKVIEEEIKKQRLEKKISSVLKIIAGLEGPKDPNKITSITKDGLVRTVYCNPGPCTPGSVILHGAITGIDMGVDVNTLAKRIETNAAQKKRQDNTNENNAKTAEDMASLGNISVDTLFEQSEADLDKTNDTSFARAQSIPLGQRIRNKEAYTDYVRSAAENEAYCLYEGGC
jgi:hypothetical protein